MVLFIIGGIVAVLLIGLVAIFNRLVTLRNRFKNAFAQIDVQLQRRHDLIPNVVEAVKGYAKHEQATFEAVVRARTAAQSALQRANADPTDAAAVGNLAAAEGTLGGSLVRLFALQEAYPDLKANESFQALMEELVTTENRIAFARQSFNDSVMSYNTGREVFPANVVAGMFSFPPASLFDIEDAAIRATPSIKLT
jgi:LemA protein